MGYDGAGYNLGVNTNLPNQLVGEVLTRILTNMPKGDSPVSSTQLPGAISGTNFSAALDSSMPMFSNSNFMPYSDVSSAVVGASSFSNNILAQFGQLCNAMMANMKTMPFGGNLNTEYNGDTSYFDYDIKRSSALDAKNLSDEDLKTTIEVAKDVGCDPYDLIAIMNNESGMDTSKTNAAGSGATGLIQFMPKTAKGLGTTTEALAKMSYSEQMVYVKKFLLDAKRTAGIPQDKKIDGATLYALIFQPAKAGSDVLAQKGQAAYDQYSNSVLDVVGNDNKITKADLAVFVNKQRKALGFETV